MTDQASDRLSALVSGTYPVYMNEGRMGTLTLTAPNVYRYTAPEHISPSLEPSERFYFVAHPEGLYHLTIHPPYEAEQPFPSSMRYLRTPRSSPVPGSRFRLSVPF